MALPPRSRLGRGLNALLATTSSPPAGDEPSTNADKATSNPVPPTGALRMLPIDRIDVNPNQPRRSFDEASLNDLAASIKANGVIQPIVVRPSQDRFQIVAGERRYRAAMLAGLPGIPAIVRAVDAYTQAQWALVENIHREDLNAIERAEAYAALMDQLNLTQAELAGRLGEQRSSIANHLRLLELSPRARDALRAGELTLGHAKVLAGISSAELQAASADACIREQWSVRELEQRLSQKDSETTAPPPPLPTADASRPHLDELESQLAQQLGVRVKLRKGKKAGTGQIVLHYATLDQFDDLVKRWGITSRAD